MGPEVTTTGLEVPDPAGAVHWINVSDCERTGEFTPFTVAVGRGPKLVPEMAITVVPLVEMRDGEMDEMDGG